MPFRCMRTGEVMKNILVIADSFQEFSKLNKELSSVDYNFLNASNFDEAFEILKHPNDITVVVSEHIIQEKSALELKRRVENYFYEFSVPFVILSSANDYKSMREALINGADDFLVKPYSSEDLKVSIEKAIEKHEKNRRKLEQKIEEAEILMSTSFNKSSDYNLFINKNYQIIGYNKTFQKIAEKLLNTKLHIGESVLKYQSLIAKEPLTENIDSAINKTPIEREIELIYPNNKKITLKVNYDPVESKSGEVLGVMYSAKNITVNKQIEKELKNISQRLEVVARAANIGIWEFYPKTNELIWNEQMFILHNTDKVLGISFEEWCNLIKETDLKSFIEAIQSPDIKFKELDLAIRIGESGQRFLKLVCYKYKEYGSNEKVIGTCWDVSNYIEMVNELTKAKEYAEKSNKLKTEFLAQMSHEVRTPISIILNYINLVKDELVDEHNLFQNYFDGIESASKRIIRTIDLILNMSELQLGIYEPIFEKINLYDDVLLTLIHEYKFIAKQKNIDFVIEGNIDDCNISGDKYSLCQIFSNLVHNSFKYTNEGYIKIVLYCSDKCQYVSVVDTGIGISEEYIDDIFKPFSQEYSGYTRRFEGNGLGLALVKKYCEINDINILVKSKKDVGTKFTLKINK